MFYNSVCLNGPQELSIEEQKFDPLKIESNQRGLDVSNPAHVNIHQYQPQYTQYLLK